MKKMMIIAFVFSFVSMASRAQFFIPYNLIPDVAVQNAYNQIQNNMKQQCEHFWDNVDLNSLPSTPAPATAPAPSASRNSNSTMERGTTSYETRSPRTSQHDRCCGTGKCNTCNGSGMMWRGYGATGKTRCPNCSGSGRCSGCNGTGRTSHHYY